MSTSRAPRFGVEPPPFEARCVPTGSDTVHVHVRGEVDLQTREVLGRALDEAWLTAASAVIVDLTDVTFISASGATVVAKARGVAASSGRTLTVLTRPGVVRWVLEFVERRDAALAE